MPDQQEKMLQRLTDIGHAYSWQNDWESGKEFYEKAFEFAVEYFGKESEEVFNVETSIVNAYNQMEEYENAVATYRRLMDYATSNFEADDERFREFHIGLANSLYFVDDEEGSLEHYEKAFSLISEEDEDYLPNLRRIIELLEKFPRGEAVQEYREILVGTLEKQGEASDELAKAADFLTSYYWKKKDFERALKFIQITYANYQSVLGESHQRTLKSGQVFSVLLFETGDFSSALSMNEKLIDYYEKNEDNEEMLLTLYYNNGMIFNNLEKYNSAADAFKKAIGISKKLNGEFHEKTVRNIQKLAQVYYDQDKETEAADLLKPYIESYERSDNPSEALLAALRKILADSCYYIPGRTLDAVKLYHQALEYYQKTSQEKSSDALIISNQLAKVQYSKLQNYKQAAQQLSEWLNDAEGIYSEDHWRMRQTRYQLAMSFYRINKFSDSEKAAKLLLEKLLVLESQKTLSKSQQITKLDTLHLLGTIALKTSGKEQAAPFITEAWELCQKYCKRGDSRQKTLKQLMSLFGAGLKNEQDYSAEKKKYFDFISKELNEPLSKRRVRVFISSTFRDMMGEREHLIKNVFPKLKSQCRELGIDFSEVDLRWGVTEDDVEQGKVIEICLDEIDRSRPYFIGILGERYGWVPTMDSFANFERVLHNYEWLKDDFEQGLSITEMEIQYGVLRNPAMKGNAFFYLRDEKLTPGEEFKEDKGSEEHKKLIELKQYLRKQEDYPVRDFDAIEQLGEMIYEDLTASVFDEEDLKIKEDSPEQKLRDQLEYINLLRDFYVPDEKLLKKVNKKLRKTNRLLLSGQHGSGKTAFLANWIADYEAHFGDAVPVFYFPDATAESKDFRVVFDDLVLQLKQVFPDLPGFQRHHPNPAQALAEVFNAI
ncbi:MAG TPA: tetratricopeptide repeat protein, partial [Bacteroidales bacterium]|nr:tetratricopeptide repeat protein [Bacteroidales bacterium]